MRTRKKTAREVSFSFLIFLCFMEMSLSCIFFSLQETVTLAQFCSMLMAKGVSREEAIRVRVVCSFWKSITLVFLCFWCYKYNVCCPHRRWWAVVRF